MKSAPTRVAIIVRHFPGDGRVSGLVSFAHQLVSAMKRRGDIKVFSGDRTPVGDPSMVRVGFPFWLRVWAATRSYAASHIVVLSGVHHPRWLAWFARLFATVAVPAERRLFIQCVTFDATPPPRSIAKLGKVAAIASLNPEEVSRLRSVGQAISMITPGLDLDAIADGPSLPRTTAFRIGFLGHFNQVKGADRIPRILEGLSGDGWDCVICGTGGLAQGLSHWAGGQRNVQLFGYLEDPMHVLRSCHVLLAPFRQSATVLGLSQVVIESLALAVPVVGTPVEAIRGAVTHGVEGLLGTSDSELTGYLQTLMGDPALRNKLSAAAAVRARGFSIERVADDIFSAFDEQEDCRK